MSARERAEFLALCRSMFWVLALVVTVWVGWSTNEAAAYNRLTGASVTTWDAMWLDLRVVSAPNDEGGR